MFNTEIDLEAPESTVNFVLTSRLAAFTGTVRDSDQNPVDGATVVLLPQPLPEGLGPGKYKAIALTGEDRKRAHELQFLHDRMQSVEAIDLEFGQTASLEVHVK